MPDRSAMSRSSHSRIVLASGTVRTEKMPGRSMPGSGGRIGAAPGDSTSLSYFSVVTSPVTWFLRSTVFCSGEMPTTSQRVRTSMANCSRNVCSVATRRLDSCAITPPTWYGNPQFAYETYGPRSTIRISALSSNLRRRAAHDAPPATPPTIITFILSYSLSSCRALVAFLTTMWPQNGPRGAPSAPATRSGRQINSYAPGSTAARLRPSMSQSPAPRRI